MKKGQDINKYVSEMLQRGAEDSLRNILEREGKGLKAWTPSIAESFANVSIRELIFDDYFLNLGGAIYPPILDDIEALYEERKERPIHFVFLEEAIGSGKAGKNDSKVYTPDGFKLMGDIKVGDIVSTPNGSTAKVVQVHPQGVVPIYKVSFSDGSCTHVTEDHLWLTSTRNERGRKKRINGKVTKHPVSSVKTTKEISNSLMFERVKWNDMKNHSIPMTKPVYFKEKDISVDPYLLGILLGDGGLTVNVTLTSSEDFILEKIKLILVRDYPELVLKKVVGSKYGYRISSGRSQSVQNKLLYDLRDMGLIGRKSCSKFIPEDYLYNSVDVRMSLLQGLMDTDGTADKMMKNRTKFGKNPSYSTSSKQLKEDIKILVESLGGVATVSTKNPWYTHDGRKLKGAINYNLTVNLPEDLHREVFTLPRKKERLSVNKKYLPVRFITAVEYVFDDFASCITLDDDDHLYLTDDFIVTHNSFMASILSYIEWFRFTAHYNPFEHFGLASNSTVAQVFMSKNANLAQKVMFDKVIPLFQSQFNKEYFPINSRITSRLHIPRNRTVLFPGSGDVASALGFDVWGAVVDEANFLEQVKGSKRGSGSTTEIFDQAQQMHDSLDARRESRFGNKLNEAGFIIMISSARYQKDFLETRIRNLEYIEQTEGEEGIRRTKCFWRKRSIWEAKPKSRKYSPSPDPNYDTSDIMYGKEDEEDEDLLWYLGYHERNEKFFMHDDNYSILEDPMEVMLFDVFLKMMTLAYKLNKQKGETNEWKQRRITGSRGSGETDGSTTATDAKRSRATTFLSE